MLDEQLVTTVLWTKLHICSALLAVDVGMVFLGSMASNGAENGKLAIFRIFQFSL